MTKKHAKRAKNEQKRAKNFFAKFVTILPLASPTMIGTLRA